MSNKVSLHWWSDGYCSRIRSERKKQKFRDEFYNRRYRMYGHYSKHDALVRCFIGAARHARIVSTRSVCSPKNIRVGDFVTSLRREIKDKNVHYNANMSSDLANKEKWDDILIPSSYASFSDDVLEAIQSARLLIDKREPAEVIDEELKRVNNDVNDLFKMLKDIENINNEADKILGGFKELAKDM